jgi:hypothetical protein
MITTYFSPENPPTNEWYDSVQTFAPGEIQVVLQGPAAWRITMFNEVQERIGHLLPQFAQTE